MTADDVLHELQAAVERALGDRAGTFKVSAVDEQLSRARQAGREALTSEQRAMLDDALDRFRRWVILRDPEARERVEGGGHAPQDIDVAVRVAEDAAIAMVVESLPPEDRRALRMRLEAITVETLAERTFASRPDLKWSDRHVRLMVYGLVVLFAMSALGSLSTVVSLGGIAVGAAMFVINFRRWRSSETTSNVSNVSQFKGGVMGRKRNQSL